MSPYKIEHMIILMVEMQILKIKEKRKKKMRKMRVFRGNSTMDMLI
jgi:hypothetical protein